MGSAALDINLFLIDFKCKHVVRSKKIWRNRSQWVVAYRLREISVKRRLNGGKTLISNTHRLVFEEHSKPSIFTAS